MKQVWRVFFRQDLTAAGVDAAKRIIDKTRESGGKLQTIPDDLIPEMRSIAAVLTPAGAVPKQ